MNQLSEVREAIVKIVPEIRKVSPEPSWVDREIRLSDVLLALDKVNEFEWTRRLYSYIVSGSAAHVIVEWDLSNDSLNDQSESTIAFLHSTLV